MEKLSVTKYGKELIFFLSNDGEVAIEIDSDWQGGFYILSQEELKKVKAWLEALDDTEKETM